MHPLLLLPDLVPVLLVERRTLSRPGSTAAGLSLADRFPRRGQGRAPRRPRGSVPTLPLPHHHELRADLPEGPKPRQGDRRDQEDDGGTSGVTLPPEGLAAGAMRATPDVRPSWSCPAESGATP